MFLYIGALAGVFLVSFYALYMINIFFLEPEPEDFIYDSIPIDSFAWNTIVPIEVTGLESCNEIECWVYRGDTVKVFEKVRLVGFENFGPESSKKKVKFFAENVLKNSDKVLLYTNDVRGKSGCLLGEIVYVNGNETTFLTEEIINV